MSGLSPGTSGPDRLGALAPGTGSHLPFPSPRAKLISAMKTAAAALLFAPSLLGSTQATAQLPLRPLHHSRSSTPPPSSSIRPQAESLSAGSSAIPVAGLHTRET